MKMKKRLLSLLLCGAMLFSLCPQVVSAEGVRNSEQAIGGLCEQQPALSVEDVQKLINELPTAEGLAAMSREEQDAAYTDLQTAYDAYKALTDEEQQEVTGAEIFDDLFELFNGMTNTLADSGFTVEGGVSGTDYELNNDTLTIKTSTSLTISTTGTDAITGQIVIAENVNADLTLEGVNISATNGKSAIELSDRSSLTLTLSQDSENTLTGASGTTDSGAPGIHVPQGAALTVLCAAAGDDSGHICGSSCGTLAIQGGSSTTALGGVGIGGGIPKDNSGSITGQPCGTVLLLGGGITVTGGTSTGNGKARDIGGSDGSGTGATGGAGGTVIILTGVQTSSGSLSIGGGVGQVSRNDGAGIKPGTGSNTYEVYGSLELPADLTIPAGVTVNIPSETTLTVPSGTTLTNYGSITGEGTLTLNGNANGNGSVSVRGFTKKGQTNAPSAPSNTSAVTATSVTLTAVTDSGGVGGIQYGYTTSGESSVPDARWQTDTTFNNLSPGTAYTFYARYAGNGFYNPSAASSTGLMVTTAAVQQTSLTEGNTYWFDLSSVEIPGTVNSALPESLAWVPFTYVGTINAYSLDSSSTDNTVTAYEHSLFISDYNVTHGASWDELNTAELIFGESYSSGGVDYELRAPSAQSNTSSEWDVILNKASQGGETGTTGYIKNWSQGFSWGQDTQMIDNQPRRVVRGSSSANAIFYFSSSSKQIGYRPVLELPADSLSDLTTVTIDLNGGSIGTTTGTVELIVKSGQNYSVPSGWELTPPDGKAFAGWKGSNGNLYSVIASIPADVTSLTALWLDKPIITKQPESATYYVGDTAEPLTVEASAASGATLGYRWFRASKDDYSDFEEIQGTIDSTTYTPTTATAGTTYYFCLVLYIDGDVGSTTIYSDPAVVTVLERTGGSGGGGTSYDYFTISASAGAGGSISPSGSVSVREGGDKTFTITPDSGYRISYVLADGKRVGAVESYTFEDVQKGHTIEAVFAKENPSRGGNPFTDVKESDWFYGDAMFVYEKGLMSGTSAAAFEPNANTTRAQMAAIFCRLDGSPAVEGRNNYTDVEYGSWYYDAVTWARQSGVMSGYGNNLFGPNDPVTRQQLAAMFCNYANYKGYDVTAAGGLSGFTDGGEISPWAQDAVKWAVGIGLMNGKGGGILDPQGTATRAEVAAMLHNFIECN